MKVEGLSFSKPGKTDLVAVMDGEQVILLTKSRLVGPNIERVVVQTSRKTVKEMTARIGQTKDAACTECREAGHKMCAR